MTRNDLMLAMANANGDLNESTKLIRKMYHMIGGVYKLIYQLEEDTSLLSAFIAKELRNILETNDAS